MVKLGVGLEAADLGAKPGESRAWAAIPGMYFTITHDKREPNIQSFYPLLVFSNICFKNHYWWNGWPTHAFNPSTWQRQVDLCEFEDSLFYIVSSGTIRAI